VLDALDPLALAGMDLHPHQVRPQPLEEHLVDKRRLTGAGDAGDHGEGPQREGNVNVAEVVFRRADDFQEFPAALAALRGNRNFLFSGEVLARKAIGIGHDLLRRAGSHHLSAVNAGAGTDVDEVIRRPHSVLVMLHHQQRVAQVPEVPKRSQQLVVVPLVKADGGLVQDIEDSHQGGADLGGQADALALAAGEGSRRPGQGQIPQAHGLQKAQTGLDLLQDPPRDAHLLLGEGQLVHPGKFVRHGQFRKGEDVQVPHRHRQGLLFQPAAVAGGTGALRHHFLQLPLAGVALGLLIAPFHIVADALKDLVQNALAPGLVIVELQLLPLGAVEDDVLHLVAQILPGRGELEAVFFGQGVKIHPGDAIRADIAPAAGLDGAVQNGKVGVRHHQGRVRLELAAQTRAGGAGAEGVVEGEHPGRQLLDGDAAVLAGVILGEHQVLLLPQEVDDHQPAGEAGGGLHAVRQALLDVRPDDEPVHHDLDVVLFVFLQLDVLVQLVEVPVHPGPDIAGALGVLEHLGVLALLAPDHRRHHLDTGALRQGKDLVNDLVDGLLADLLAALGAVGRAHPGPEEPQVVVDLRHRAHGGAGVFAGGLLVNGDGGGKSLDIVHIRLVHLAQEHPGVGGETLHIPPLAFGVDGIEGQGALAGAGEARHHHQLVPGDGDVDIFQVVDPGALDDDLILHMRCCLLRL